MSMLLVNNFVQIDIYYLKEMKNLTNILMAFLKLHFTRKYLGVPHIWFIINLNYKEMACTKFFVLDRNV